MFSFALAVSQEAPSLLVPGALHSPFGYSTIRSPQQIGFANLRWLHYIAQQQVLVSLVDGVCFSATIYRTFCLPLV
jgi:hypothetical protein